MVFIYRHLLQISDSFFKKLNKLFQKLNHFFPIIDHFFEYSTTFSNSRTLSSTSVLKNSASFVRNSISFFKFSCGEFVDPSITFFKFSATFSKFVDTCFESLGRYFQPQCCSMCFHFLDRLLSTMACHGPPVCSVVLPKFCTQSVLSVEMRGHVYLMVGI